MSTLTAIEREEYQSKLKWATGRWRRNWEVPVEKWSKRDRDYFATYLACRDKLGLSDPKPVPETSPGNGARPYDSTQRRYRPRVVRCPHGIHQASCEYCQSMPPQSIVRTARKKWQCDKCDVWIEVGERYRDTWTTEWGCPHVRHCLACCELSEAA